MSSPSHSDGTWIKLRTLRYFLFEEYKMVGNYKLSFRHTFVFARSHRIYPVCPVALSSEEVRVLVAARRDASVDVTLLRIDVWQDIGLEATGQVKW